MMSIQVKTISQRTALLCGIAASSPFAGATLLIDPGFEFNPLTSHANVLGNFPVYQGQWGAELGAITGIDNGVTPFQGSNMLRMSDEGGVTTQAFQVTDVSSFASVIDAGNATVTLSALFNVDAQVPAAVGSVYLQFFGGPSYGTQIGTGAAGPIFLDNAVHTWETASLTMNAPVGTRWVMSQVYYSNASLLGNDGTFHPGYVDMAELTMVPGPSVLSLLVLGTLTGLGGRKRRRNA
jgi:hypothetical protein